ncbi:thiolase C-terminal domain-containing protein [Rhodococcus opacus]|uniref:thiolase C-terminal domain-containing protein n=1 Tax=Rhodococcus opacus TaxID=37919 RepID=UPI00155AEC23|nr:thiolase [Rhodococcus opacus]
MSATAAIVGAAETTRLGIIPDMTALALNVEASMLAIRDSGLDIAEIDGIASTGHITAATAEALGIRPRWIDNTHVGGCSYFLHLRHAIAAIETGRAKAVLVTHGQSGRSRLGEEGFSYLPSGPNGQFEAPYGVGPFFTMFTLTALRFMKDLGITHEQLAMVAVAQRRWAHLNPRAFSQDLLTVDDVLNAPLIAYPFHKPQCCVVTDGGGAFVVTSVDRAKDVAGPAAYVLGTGESYAHTMVSQMDDFTTSRAFRDAGTEAFAQAGVTPADIDHLQVYDAFAHVPLYALEDLGFVGRGESGAFVEEGHTAPGGSLPMNTNGGGLAYTHTGMYGMFALQESIRQIRRRAAAQVDDVELAFSQGVGGMFEFAGSAIFATQPD